MPPPFLAGPIALAASKNTALHAATVSASTVTAYDAGIASTALTTYMLARLAWITLPSWVKDDVSVKNFSRSSGKSLQEVEHEMATLSLVVNKLQLLLASGATKLRDHEEQSASHLQASFLCYLQLAAQIRRLHPHQRDRWYERSASPPSLVGCMSRFHLDPDDIRNAFDWSVLAYEADTKRLSDGLGEDFEVLQHNAAPTSPGTVGHFVASSRRSRLVVIGVKGTSSFEDFLTDCCGRAVPLEDKSSFQEVFEVSVSGPDTIDVSDAGVEVTSGHERIWMHTSCDNEIRCHEGILLSAKRLSDKVSKVFQDLVVNEEYNCILCGHSLGAGVAALLGTLLRVRFPFLESDGRRLRVFAFAPPPVLDYESSLAASSYILSIVNNSDAIPRFSLANVLIFLEFLRHVSLKLVERGLSPSSPANVAALLQKLLKGANDDDMIMTMDEVEEARESACRAVKLSDPFHLYIPGRVLILHDRRDSAESFRDSPNGAQGYVDVYEAEGGCDILRFFELDGLAPISDHVCSSYAANLSRLCATIS
jgi:hypothetical protein